MTDTTTDWSQYEAIVGKRWYYYRPRFERFARGGWLSWNWAAFFGTLAWLRYRRLYACSWLYFFVSTPFLLSIVMLVATGTDACERELAGQTYDVAPIAVFAVAALGWILPPLVADRIYFGHVRAMLGEISKYTGTRGYAGALFLQLCVLLGPVLVLPGYSSYIYRSMVSEGASLAGAAKTPVAEYFSDHKRLPARIEEVASMTSGKYVGQLKLERDGTIRAIFGAGGRKLSGHSISMIPTIRDGRIVEWACRSDDLPDKCLPGSCRRDR